MPNDSRGEIVVAYVLNGECDKQYSNGTWEYPEASYWIIHRLCVSPKFQNQKIGHRTSQYIEKQVLENDIESIRLDAFVQNPYVIRLYEKLLSNQKQ